MTGIAALEQERLDDMTWRWWILVGLLILVGLWLVREITSPVAVELSTTEGGRDRERDHGPGSCAQPGEPENVSVARSGASIRIPGASVIGEAEPGPTGEDACASRDTTGPGSTLTVRVRGRGAALPGARVRLLRNGRMCGETTTDPDGEAVFAGLESGFREVQVRALGWLAQNGSVSLAKGESTALTLDLEPGGQMVVNVVEEATRKPVESARVRLLVPAADLAQAVTTGPGGRAEFRAVPPGAWAEGRLEVECPGYFAVRARSGQAFLRTGPDQADIQVIRAARVSGTVLDGDGRPVARGLVHVDAAAHEAGRVVLPLAGEDVDGTWVRRGLWARTDAEGRFDLAAVPPARPLVLVVRASGRPAQRMRLTLGAGESRHDVRIRLEPGVCVEGRVWTPDQEPATGIQVRVARNGRLLLQVRTDEQGRFVVRDLKAGSHGLKACGRPWIDSAVRTVEVHGRGLVDNLSLRLRRAAPDITGRVVDAEGRPTSGIEVSAHGLDRPGLFTEETFWPVRDRTDEEGRFRLQGIRPDWTYAIHVHPPDSALPLIRKPLISPAPELLFVVSKTGGLEAEVPPEAGRETTHVAALRVGDDPAEVVRAFQASPFRIEGLAPGTYCVEARHGSVVVARAGAVVVRPDTITRNVRLEATVQPAVTGRVVDGAGQPLAGVPVATFQKRPEGGPVVRTVHTGADGRFALRGLRPGAHDLMVGDSGLGYAVCPGVTAGTRDLEVVLAPSCRVRAVVKARDSRAPVVGAAVGLVIRGGGTVQQVTDARGEVAFCVPPGLYALVAVAAGYEHLGCRVSVQPAGREVCRELWLAPDQP